MEVQAVGLLGATLAVQLCLLILIAITNRVLPNGKADIQTKCDKAALLLTLVTVACVVLSEELWQLSMPMFGGLGNSLGVSRNSTFSLLFLSDLAIAFRLVQVSGGSKSSPFTSILFLLPTVAIFLREPASRFLIYAFVAGGLYLVGLIIEKRNTLDIAEPRALSAYTNYYSIIRTDTPAHAIVNIGCLVIGITTGYVTRPPIIA